MWKKPWKMMPGREVYDLRHITGRRKIPDVYLYII